MTTHTMNQSLRRPAALLLAALVGAATLALAVGSRTPGAAAEQTALDSFLARLEAGVEVDYTPLTSPGNALAVGESAVLGRLVDVREGVSLDFGDKQLNERASASYATLAIEVEEVLGGRVELARGEIVYVQLPVGKQVDLEALRRDNPEPQVVTVLDELSDWDPGSAKVVRPREVPDRAPLFAAYQDGLWFAGPEGELVGIHAEAEDLAEGWKGVQTVKEFAELLRTATPERIEPTEEPAPDGHRVPTGEPTEGGEEGKPTERE